MYKKILVSIGILLAIILSSTICFANDGLQDMANGVRNAVGGVENAVEGAAKNVSDASKNATGAVENTANNITTHNDNQIANNVDNQENMTGRINGNYNATRTATTSDTFMGMNATVWTWLILGVAAIAIVALVWYYSVQLNHNRYDNED